MALWWPNLDGRCQGHYQRLVQFYVLVETVRTATGRLSYPFVEKEIARQGNSSTDAVGAQWTSADSGRISGTLPNLHREKDFFILFMKCL